MEMIQTSRNCWVSQGNEFHRLPFKLETQRGLIKCCCSLLLKHTCFVGFTGRAEYSLQIALLWKCENCLCFGIHHKSVLQYIIKGKNTASMIRKYWERPLAQWWKCKDIPSYASLLQKNYCSLYLISPGLKSQLYWKGNFFSFRIFEQLFIHWQSLAELERGWGWCWSSPGTSSGH